MDDEKKKKRNKKKKNKQAKQADNGTAAVPVSIDSVDQNRAREQNPHGEASRQAEVQGDAVQKPNTDPEAHHNNKFNNASLEETIKKLQNENETHIQKEPELKTRISHMQSEKDFWLQKEESLDDKISQLLNENDTLRLQVANLEKEVKCLMDEKDSWVLNEKITKETLSRLNDDNTRLRLQVVELEESRKNLFHENELSLETISSLQSQIQSLEVKKGASADQDWCSEIDAARVLIEKLVTENAELVEKVNELYSKLARQMAANYFSDMGPDSLSVSGNTEVAYSIPAAMDITSASGDKMELDNAIATEDEPGDRNMDIENISIVPNSLKTDKSIDISRMPGSAEIVKIPLDENEVGDLDSPTAPSDEKDAVPLSDAPLIGAPFRLVSFVSKYVSGADLINRD